MAKILSEETLVQVMELHLDQNRQVRFEIYRRETPAGPGSFRSEYRTQAFAQAQVQTHVVAEGPKIVQGWAPTAQVNIPVATTLDEVLANIRAVIGKLP